MSNNYIQEPIEEEMDFKTKLANLLAEVVSIPKNQIAELIETPPNPDMGDFAFPCFSLSKVMKKAPNEIAKNLASKISSKDFTVTALGPYLNFFANESKLATQVLEKINSEKEKYGDSKEHVGEQVIVDMIGLNPNKAGHIGHVKNGCVSDTISRCMNKVGYKTVKQSFVNDMGVPTSMVFWAHKNLKGLPKKTGLLKKEDHWQGAVYVMIEKLYEKDPKIKQKIEAMHSVLESDKDPKLSKEQRAFADSCCKAQSETWKRLRCELDLSIHESDLVRAGLVDLALRKLQEADAIYEKDGALYFELSRYPVFQGMQNPDKLLVRSDGRVAYTGKDIAMQFWKHQAVPDKFKYSIVSKSKNHTEWTTNQLTGKPQKLGFNKNTKSLYVVAAEQKYVIAVDLYALKAIGLEKEFKQGYHLAYGLVGFGGQAKIASREGTVGLTADEILNQAAELALKEIKKRNPKLAVSKQKEIAEIIGSSAVRYYLIKTDPTRFVQFTFEDALDFNGNTGPYLQYALVRAKKIIKKVGKVSPKLIDYSLLSTPQELALIKKLADYPQIVLEAAEQYAPHKLANYSFELCQYFSTFYEACPVNSAEDSLKATRVELVKAFKQVLSNSLYLLGIEELEAM